MPLGRISLRKGKPAAYRRAILDGIYGALRDTFDVPDEDRFLVVTQLDAEDFDYSRSYLGIERSDDFVLIQLTVSNTRGVELLADDPGLRPQDVFINLVEVLPENWSFGNGIAQYVKA